MTHKWWLKYATSGQCLQGVRGQTAAARRAVYAAAAEGHDVRARGQQDQPGRSGELREDAHDGANDAHDSTVPFEALG